MNHGTPMKKSNRNACLRRVKKRLAKGTITEEQAKILIPIILVGDASRQQVYGFHPTKRRTYV